MIRYLALLFLVAALCCAPAHAVTFDWAHIGNAGNAADPKTGFGAVSYGYGISKTEVTNAQYTEFLNAVAATDNFGGSDPMLYSTGMGSTTLGGITRSGSEGSYTYAVKTPAVGKGPGGADYTYHNKPVVWVSFIDAMRFANWLHNGQGSGGTETGAYNISDGVSEIRSASAKFWIPSEDEWYKAAYYAPNAGGGSGAYFNYPTFTNRPLNNNLPSADTGRSANFLGSEYTTGDSSYPMTDVGAYSLSESPYGTFDQGGNVGEWNETFSLSSTRRWRGGSWNNHSDNLSVNGQASYPPSRVRGVIGFRVATIPEPSTVLLGAFVAGGLLMRRRV